MFVSSDIVTGVLALVSSEVDISQDSIDEIELTDYRDNYPFMSIITHANLEKSLVDNFPEQ